MYRIGMIGIEGHGHQHINHVLELRNVSVVAICDIKEAILNRDQDMVKKATDKRPIGYAEHEYSYRELLEEEDLNAVITATPCRWHIPIAIDTMKAGAYAAVEPGVASTLKECWELV